MIRFAALQLRMQAAAALGTIVVVAIVLALTGPHLVNLYDTIVVPCSTHNDCAAATTALTDTYGPLQVFLVFLLLVIPVLIGMFWGAALAREYESGTYRLVVDPRRDTDALAGRQARPRSVGERDCRWTAQPHGHLVVESSQRGRCKPL